MAHQRQRTRELSAAGVQVEPRGGERVTSVRMGRCEASRGSGDGRLVSAGRPPPIRTSEGSGT